MRRVGCDVCWNATVSLCEECAPDIQEELAVMQQQRRLEQVQERVEETDYASGIDVSEPAVVVCPHCGAKAAGGKFCNQCGGRLAATIKCPKCKAENPANAKFCSECGEALT